MAFRGLLAALVMAAAALYSTDAWALDRYWVGGSSNSWMDPLNWSLGQPTGGATGIPTGNDRAVINSGTPTIVSGTGIPIASEVLIDYLFVGAAGTLVIQDGMNLVIRSDGASWTSPFGFNSYVEGTGTVSTPPNAAGPAFGTGQILIRNGTNGILFNQNFTAGNIRLDYTNGKPNISNPSQALRISSNITITVNGHLNMALGAIQLGTNPNSGGVVLDVRGDIRIGDPVDPLSASFLYLKAAGTTIKCGGNWLQGGGKLKDTTGASTTIFNGSGPQTIQVNNADLGSCEFDTMIIGPGSRTVIYMNNPSLAPGFNVTVSLTLNNNVTFRLQDGVIGIGSILFQDGGGASNAVLRLEGAVANLTTTLSAGIGTVEYAGVGIAQTVRASAGPYYNLTIDNSNNVQATQENAALTVQRDLLIGKTLAAGTSAARFTGAAQNITVGNDVTCNGTFTHGGSTVIMRTTLDGSGSIRSDLPNPPPIALTFNALTVSGGVVPSPTATMVAALQNIPGNVTTGAHSYTATFLDANNFESAMSPASNIVSTDAANGRVDLSSIPIGPTGVVKRRIYRTVAGNGGSPQFLTEIADNVTTNYVDNTADASLGAIGILKVQPNTAPTAALLLSGGTVDLGTHFYAVSFVDPNGIESALSPSSNTVTVDATHRQVAVSAIAAAPAAPAGYTKRLYRTLASTANLRLIATLPAAQATFTDNVADNPLAAAPPGNPLAPLTAPTVALLAAPGNVTAGTHTYRVTFVNANFVESAPGPSSAVVTTTAANPRVSLTAIPIGPAGIIERRIYRTVSGNTGTPQFVAEIGDNTTTTYTDNTSDGWLGADGPITPAPPSAAPTTTLGAAGNVNAGLHSWYVTFVTAVGVESAPGPGSDPLNVPVGGRQVNVTSIPTGPGTIARRRIYRKVAGNTGSPLFLREIADNTTTTLTPVDSTADAALGVAAPPAAPSGILLAVVSSGGSVDDGTHSYCVSFVDATNLEGPAGPFSNVVTATVGNRTVILYNIPLGPAGAGVVRRRIYRTVAGNTGSPLLLAEIADNTTTDFKDTFADSTLGVAASTTPQITVVTAERNFAVASTFTVPRGKLTLSPGVAVDAQFGLTVGDNVLPGGSAFDAMLELLGNVTLRVGASRTFLVQPNDGAFVAGNLTSAAPTVTNVGDSGALGRFLTSVQGIVDITRLEFRCAEVAGLNINTTAAKVKNLRNVAFRNINPQTNSRHLTINAPNLDMDCPGCYFDTVSVPLPPAYNVQATGANTNMRLRFEDRRSSGSTAERGPGAGEAFDNDNDTNANGVLDGAETPTGSIVQWVYTANVDMAGSIQGFPMPAFDWFTFQQYSTYVLMRNSSGAADSIYVLDGSGDLKSYSFTLPAGDIVGPLFWNSEAGGHYVYFGTSTGEVYRLLDTGSSLAPAGGSWATPYTDPNLLAVTSPVMSDGVNLYFAGQASLAPTYALYKVVISSKSAPDARISTSNVQVTTGFAWWDFSTTRYVFGASRSVGSGASFIGRWVSSGWSVDGVFAGGTSDFTGNVNIANTRSEPTFYLYAGEANGYLHAVKALGTIAEFGTVQRAGFPFRDKISAIRTGAILDFTFGRVFFGNDAGDLYTLLPNTTFFSKGTPDASPIRGMLLFEGGVLYGANGTGKVYALDVNNPSAPGGQLLFMTFNLGTMALGDISKDPLSERLYVASASGRLHSFERVADPTPLNE